MSKFLTIGKRALTLTVAGTTILWSLGLASLAPAHAATLVAGDLIKASGPAVYYYTADGKRAPFPNEKVYNSWFVGYGKVKTITDTELAALSLSGTNMTYRPGTRLVKITTDPKVYAVQPGGSLHWVKTEEIAKALYGDNWNKQIDDVADVFFTNYSKGSDVESAKPTVGSLVKTAGSSDIYFVDADGKRKLSDLAAFDANGFQSKFVRTVSDAVLAALTASAKGEVKAKEATVAEPQFAAAPAAAKPGETPAAPQGKQMLTVAVASDNPAGAVHASGTSYNKVLALNLTAGADADVTLTSLTLTRGGLASDTSLSGVAVFAHKATMRHGTFATFSNNKATVSMSNDPIKIAKGTTVELWVKANINSAAAGQSGTYTLGVNAAADMGTSAEVTGTFPFTSSTFSLTSGANVVGTLTADAVRVHDNGATDATVVNVNMGATDQDTGKFRFAAGANEDMILSGIQLYNNGNTTDDDLANIDLVGPDGAVLATVAKTKDKYITFDLSALKVANSDQGGYLIPKGASRDLAVREDVVSGSSRTVRWLVQNDYDVEAYGVSSKAGILATLSGGNSAPTGSDRAFPIGDQDGGANTNYVNKVTISAGTLTMGKATTSPTGNVPAGGTLVQFAKYEVKASGEDMELRQIQYRIDRSPANATSSLSGTFTVKIQEAGATSSPTTIFTVAGSAATYESLTSATLTTYPTLKSNKTYYITYEGDIGSTVPAGTTYSTRLDVIQVYRKNSNDTVDPTVNVATANTLTVTTGTLSVAANQSQAPISVVQNQSVVTTLGSWTLTAGPAEPIVINSVTIDDDTAGLGRNFKELEVWMNGAKRSQDTSSTVAPTATTQTVSFNLSPAYEIPAGQTVVLDVKGKVLTSTMDTTVTMNIGASGVSGSGKTSLTSLSTTPAVAVNAQAITISSSGTLTVSRDTVTNVRSSQVVAGTTGVTFGAYKFQTSNTEGIKIRKIYLSNAGSNVNGLTNIALYDGSANPLGGIKKASLGSDSLITGGDERSVVFDYTGLADGGYLLDKNTFKVLTVKADSVYAATSGQTAQFAIADIEAEGVGSGTRVYVTLLSDDSPATADQAYAVGDVVSVNDADSPGATSTPLIVSTARASGANNVGTDIFGVAGSSTPAATDVYGKWRTLSTETVASASATATNNYAVGDVVVVWDASASTTAMRVVTNAISAGGTFATGAGTSTLVNQMTRLSTGDIVTRVPAGASAPIGAVSTLTFKAGDVVVVSDLDGTDGSGVYVVGSAINAGSNLQGANGLVNGYTFASGRVTKLPVITTELASTTTAYAYRLGEVVAIHDADATTDDGLFVVNAARAIGTDATAAGGLVRSRTFTTSDRISRLAVVQTSDNVKRLYPTKLNFAWTAASGGSVLSTGGQVEVARFTMGADTANAANPDAAVSVSSLNFTMISSATLTNATLHDFTNNTNVATNVTPDRSGGALNFSSTFLTAQSFNHGETRTFRILADVGTSAGSQSAQFRFNAGSDLTSGSATWTVSATGQSAQSSTWTALAGDATDALNAQMTSASVASDAVAPTISSVAITDGTAGDDALNASSTIALTFTEKIDPASVSTSLRYGAGRVSVAAGATGAVAGADNSGGTNACGTASSNDTINVVNLACISLATTTAFNASSTSGATVVSLNSAGTILTVELVAATTLDAPDTSTSNANTKADGGEILTAVRDAAGNLLAASAWTVTNLNL